MGPTTSKSLVAPVSLVEQDMVPMQPPSTMRCQGACGVPPAPTKARDGGHSWEHPCHTQQHPSPATGWWALSEPPPWGQVP